MYDSTPLLASLKMKKKYFLVTDVPRNTVRRDGIIKPTNTFVLTFNSSNLPTVVKIGFINVKVDVYKSFS